MKKILVLGATGYTGEWVTRALVEMGAEVILAARNQTKLDALARELKVSATRVIASPFGSNLDALFEGAGVVVNTVGPFLRFGLPVVARAIEKQVHYVDITGEQAFIRQVVKQFHTRAVARHVAVMCAQAYEFALGYSAGALLASEFGELARLETIYRSSGTMSHGTLKSSLQIFSSEAYEFREGQAQRVRARWNPSSVKFPNETKTFSGVPFPSGESVLLPANQPTLREVNSYLVLPRALATQIVRWRAFGFITRPLLKIPGIVPWLEKQIESRFQETASAQQTASRFTVLARGTTTKGARIACRIDGRDAYVLTGRIAAQVALWLADGKNRAVGVVSTDRAFEARLFLDSLQPFDVKYEMRREA